MSQKGRYGIHGGQYIPETLMNEIKKLEDAYEFYKKDEEFNQEHQGMGHGGRVIRQGKTSREQTSTIEYALNLESNPEFTASVLVAYARAIAKLAKEGKTGACSVFDIPPAYLSAKSSDVFSYSFISILFSFISVTFPAIYFLPSIKAIMPLPEIA